MNGPFVVAQANTGTGSAAGSPQVIKLSKPQGGDALVVQASYDGSVLIDFSTIANERITLVHIGEKLIILFDNQSTLTINPFFDSMGVPLSNVQVEVAPGRDLPSSEFAATFPITTDQSVLPAAGGTAGAPASGADFHNPAVDPLGLPLPLDLLPPTELPRLPFTDITAVIPQSQTVTPPPPPSPPVANNDSAATHEDAAININVLANDQPGQPGDTLTVTGVPAQSADGAALSIVAGQVHYDPNTVSAFETIQIGHSVTDSFTYTVTDSHGATSSATVSLEVSVVDSPPTATGGSVATNEDHTVSGTLSFAAGESDDGGDGATLLHTGTISTADLGIVTLNANGTFTYDPTAVSAFETIQIGHSVTDSFTFTVTDSHGQTVSATETIAVSVLDSPPTATGGSVATNEDHTVSGTLSFAAGESDDGGDGATLLHTGTISTADLGIVTLNANGTFTYDPTAVSAFETIQIGHSVTDSFTFTVTDSHGQTVSATETIAVSVLDSPPTATGGSVATNEDHTVSGTLSFAAGESDDGGDGATLLHTGTISTADLGIVTLNANGTFTYDPTAVSAFETIQIGHSVTDSFTFTVTDSHGQTVSATETIAVSVLDSPPTATGGSVATNEDHTVSGTLSFAAGESDDGGDGATLLHTGTISTADLGIVTLNANGTFTYDPTAVSAFETIQIGHSVTDSFTFTVTDSHGQTVSATETIAVSVLDSPPTATGGSVATNEDHTVSGTLSFAAGESDDGGDGATLLHTGTISTADLGIVTLNANGTFTYDPTAVSAFETIQIGHSVTDSFTFTVTDSHGQTVSATETIAVSVLDSPPTATGGSVATNEDHTVSGTLSFAAGESDDGGDGATLLHTGTISTADLGIVTLNANGTFTYDPTAVSAFETIQIGHSVTDSFTFTVTDSHGQTVSATETIAVSVLDSPPTATGGSVATNEDHTVSGTLSFAAGESDDGGDGATLLHTGTISTADLGIVTLNANGTFTYDPTAVSAFETIQIGHSVTDSFTFTVTDSHGQTVSATETIAVSVLDSPPTATGGSVATNEDHTVSGTLSFAAGESDDGGDGATLLHTGTISTADLGIVTLNANGTFTYDPTAVSAFETIQIGHSVTDSFTFTVTDSHGQTVSATETIAVSVLDSPPTATGGSVATNEDHTVSGTLSFAAGESDDGGDGATLLHTGTISTADLGIVTLNANGTFTYDPTAVSAFETIQIGHSVTDSFTFTVTDSHGQTVSATETIAVSVVDSPPTATGGSVATNEDHTVSGTLSFAAGESDDGGDGATLLHTGTISTADLGIVTLNANGTFTYDPTAVSAFETIQIGHSVTDSFTFTVTDSHGQTVSATETIAVSVLDSPPTATGGSVATNEDHTVSGTLSFAAGESDDGGDGATLLHTGTISTADLGIVTLNANGTFTYDPTAVSAFETIQIGHSVTDSFTFTVTDSHGQTVSATETIAVSVLDSPPTATGGSVATNEDHTVSGTLSFAAGESDDGGDGATLLHTGTISTADLGIVTLNANGTFTYDPTAVSAFETIQIGHSVTDSFTFTVTDSHGQTVSATETIAVSVLDSPPTATGGSVATNEDHTVSGTLSFAAGESDDGGDGATLLHTGTISTADLGIVTLNANGTFTYDPTAVSAFETIQIGHSVTDSFTFTVTDSHGQTVSATETIAVSVLDSPPTATGGSVATNEDHTVSGTLSFAAGESDDGGDGATLLHTGTISTADLGIVTLNANGTFTYDPTAVSAFETIQIGHSVTDSFTFTVTDSHGQTVSATETIAVSVLDSPPTATGGSVATNEDHTVSGTLSFAAGESDDGGDGATLLHTGTISTADLGIVTLNANGTFTYDPTAVSAFETIQIGHSVTDSFTFTVTDSHGQTVSATETIAVSVVDSPPTATGGSVATNEDHTVSGTLSFAAGESDDGGDGATLLHTGTISTADLGIVTLNANGTFTYDPTHVSAFETVPEGSSMTDSFTFTVTDSHGQTVSATETIAVAGDLPPAPTDLAITATSDRPAGFFALGDNGNLDVQATFPAHPAGETHTIDIKLQPGFTTSDLTAGTHTGWTDTHTGTTYTFVYTYTPTNGTTSGDILVQIPDTLAADAVDLKFDITAPSSGTLPTNLTFAETATTSPAGDTVDGSIPVASGGDEQVVSISTQPPAAHLLTGAIVTNSNVNHQVMVLSFVDQAHPVDAFSIVIDTNAQGQQGIITQDAGFNISNSNHYLVGLDEPFVTSKIIITNFNLNGVTMVEPSGNIQLESDGSKAHAFTAEIQPNGTTPVTGQDSTDSFSSTNNATVTDPTPNGATATNASLDFLYGGGTGDTLNGSSDSEFLAATGTGSTVNGGAGSDILVWNPGNTYNGGTGFDILRVDQGAEWNSKIEDPASFVAPGVTSATVVLDPTHLSSMQEILITEEATPATGLGTELDFGSLGSGLTVAQEIAFTDLATTDNPTGVTAPHALFIVGSQGDDVQLATGAGGWQEATGPGSTYTSPGGQVFHEWIPTGSTLATATATIFIDNDVQVNHVHQ